MAADDDLDALEAQLEDYDDDDDDDDLPPLKRIWKKFKILIVMGVALIIFVPVILMSVSGPKTLGDRRVVVVPELAPEPGKQVKMTPEQPGGERESGKEEAVYNMVAEGENAGKIAITAPPEDPKNPPAEGKAPEGADAPLAMLPEGVEKTPKDGKSAEGTMVPPVMPPPTPPEKEGEVALPALPAPSAPAKGDGKTAENILPAAPTVAPVPDPKPAEPLAPVAVQPVEPPATVAVAPVQPPAPPKAPEINNQIAVVIPKVTQTIAPPPTAPPAGTTATPMRTMAGVYRVQVASTRSEASAKTIWNKQVSKHPDVLGQLPLTVQSAVIQDRGTFYRVQGGAFGDREAADSICRKLKSRGQDCLVVRP